MASQDSLPGLMDADEVAYYVSLLHVSSLPGIDNPRLRRHVQQGMRRFTARAYLGFDPLRKAPSALPGRSRYDVWCDALVLTYTGRRIRRSARRGVRRRAPLAPGNWPVPVGRRRNEPGDAGLLSEFTDSLPSFGVAQSDPALSSGVEYLLSSQNRDGN